MIVVKLQSPVSLYSEGVCKSWVGVACIHTVVMLCSCLPWVFDTTAVFRRHMIAGAQTKLQASFSAKSVGTIQARTSLPGELRLASYAPSPGWHAFQSSCPL